MMNLRYVDLNIVLDRNFYLLVSFFFFLIKYNHKNYTSKYRFLSLIDSGGLHLI